MWGEDAVWGQYPPHIRGFRATLARGAEWCTPPQLQRYRRRRNVDDFAETMTLRRRLPPPPISPCFLRRAPPFRCERSEQAEPPTITTQVSPRKSQIANRPRKKRPPFREALGIHRINVLLIFNTSQRSAIAFRSILGRIFLSSTYIQGYCITIRHNTP